MAINFKWTSEADVFLRQCRGSGDSFKQVRAKINERFGTNYSLNACIGRAARLGLAPRKPRKRRRYTVVPEIAAPIPESIAAPPSITPATIPVGSIASRLSHAIRAKAKQAASAEPDPLPLRCVAIEPKHLSIMDLTDETCRWPIGGWPEATLVSYCGHFIWGASSYCEAHHALSRASHLSAERKAA